MVDEVELVGERLVGQTAGGRSKASSSSADGRFRRGSAVAPAGSSSRSRRRRRRRRRRPPASPSSSSSRSRSRARSRSARLGLGARVQALGESGIARGGGRSRARRPGRAGLRGEGPRPRPQPRARSIAGRRAAAVAVAIRGRDGRDRGRDRGPRRRGVGASASASAEGVAVDRRSSAGTARPRAAVGSSIRSAPGSAMIRPRSRSRSPGLGGQGLGVAVAAGPVGRQVPLVVVEAGQLLRVGEPGRRGRRLGVGAGRRADSRGSSRSPVGRPTGRRRAEGPAAGLVEGRGAVDAEAAAERREPPPDGRLGRGRSVDGPLRSAASGGSGRARRRGGRRPGRPVLGSSPSPRRRTDVGAVAAALLREVGAIAVPVRPLADPVAAPAGPGLGGGPDGPAPSSSVLVGVGLGSRRTPRRVVLVARSRRGRTRRPRGRRPGRGRRGRRPPGRGPDRGSAPAALGGPAAELRLVDDRVGDLLRLVDAASTRGSSAVAVPIAVAALPRGRLRPRSRSRREGRGSRAGRGLVAVAVLAARRRGRRGRHRSRSRALEVAAGVAAAVAGAEDGVLVDLVAVVAGLDVGDVEEAVAADGEVDEGGLDGRLDVDDPALVDVAGVALQAGPLDVELLEDAVLDDGDAALLGLEHVDQHLFLLAHASLNLRASAGPAGPAGPDPGWSRRPAASTAPTKRGSAETRGDRRGPAGRVPGVAATGPGGDRWHAGGTPRVSRVRPGPCGVVQVAAWGPGPWVDDWSGSRSSGGALRMPSGGRRRRSGRYRGRSQDAAVGVIGRGRWRPFRAAVVGFDPILGVRDSCGGSGRGQGQSSVRTRTAPAASRSRRPSTSSTSSGRAEPPGSTRSRSRRAPVGRVEPGVEDERPQVELDRRAGPAGGCGAPGRGRAARRRPRRPPRGGRRAGRGGTRRPRPGRRGGAPAGRPPGTPGPAARPRPGGRAPRPAGRGSASSSSRTSRRPSIPRARARGKETFGRGLNPWLWAIGSSARRRSRSRQRIRS